jgi:hypothetical protein
VQHASKVFADKSERQIRISILEILGGEKYPIQLLPLQVANLKESLLHQAFSGQLYEPFP